MATIIFKPTEACNAGCSYCDVVRKDTRITQKMPLELLELMFSRINEFLTARRNEQIDLVWHGGEPLMLGREYFYKAYEFQQKHCPDTCQRINHAVQTNLTLFSSEFTEIFNKLGIKGVGTSYDPVKNVRTLPSFDNGPSAYNRKFMEGVAALEKEGFGWGPIYVVTKRSLDKPLDIFYFLTNLNPDSKVMFNPVLIYGEDTGNLRITAEEFANFLGAIFPVWWQNRHRYPQIDPFSAWVNNIVDKKGLSLGCCESGNCYNSHINIAPDGTYSLCGRASDWGLLEYGTIRERSMLEVFDDPQRKMLSQRDEELLKGDCKGCRLWNICHGGCPLDSWSWTRSFMRKSEWCDVKRIFIRDFLEPITNTKYNGT